MIGVVAVSRPLPDNPGRGPQADSSGVSGTGLELRGWAEAAHQAPLSRLQGVGLEWACMVLPVCPAPMSAPHGMAVTPTQHLLTDVAGVGPAGQDFMRVGVNWQSPRVDAQLAEQCSGPSGHVSAGGPVIPDCWLGHSRL